MPTRKIEDLPNYCDDPDHYPHYDVKPGVYVHECPSCGSKRIFHTPNWKGYHNEKPRKMKIPQIDPRIVYQIAVDARNKSKLRHVPLLIARLMAQGGVTHKSLVGKLLTEIIQRPDEMTELLAMYWGPKVRIEIDAKAKAELGLTDCQSVITPRKQPLAAQIKKGLAKAFTKFNAYELAKYNTPGKTVSLKDVLFISHPVPKDQDQQNTWDQLVKDELPIPDTWEVALSTAHTPDEKKAVWERLLSENKLGALALLRNLRNMTKVQTNETLIRQRLADIKVERVLPFRFIAAARYAPQFETKGH